MNLWRKKVLKWQIISVFWVLIIGSLLHFTYEWSGKSPIVGAFSSVNESVWEHLKLGYWSMIFFCLIEYPFLKYYAGNYFFAKAVGIISMNVFIVVFFYLYAALTGKHSLFFDILLYIIGAVIFGILSYTIMIGKHNSKLNKLGFGLLLVFGLVFVLFTYFPPDFTLFKAP